MHNMATEIIAKHHSICPVCSGMICKGARAKVYYGKWLHPHCWDLFAKGLRDRRELMSKTLGKDLFNNP